MNITTLNVAFTLLQINNVVNPSKPHEEFWIGLAGGVASSAIFAIIVFFVNSAKNSIVFKIQTKQFEAQLTDISGRWEGEPVVRETISYQETLFLKQQGPKITGTLTYVETGKNGNPVVKIFGLNGIYREKVLTVYFVNEDLRSGGAGTITAVLRGGKMLDGRCDYYDDTSPEIRNLPEVECIVTSDVYKWNRT